MFVVVLYIYIQQLETGEGTLFANIHVPGSLMSMLQGSPQIQVGLYGSGSKLDTPKHCLLQV